MLAAPKTKRLAVFISLVTIEETKDPLPILLNSIASSRVLYGIIVDTGPKASTSWQSVFVKGFLLTNRVGEIKAPFPFSAPIKSSSLLPNTISWELLSKLILSETSFNCSNPAKLPILTPSTWGSPIVVFNNLLHIALFTSSNNSSGTIILLIAVHFWPAFTVISFWTSLTNRSNSIVPGTASFARTEQFNESASILNDTASSTIFGCDFNFLPVEALPVKVTTSSDDILSSIPLALPQINCKQPSGNIFESIISLNITWVRYEVIVAGLTIAGIPAIRFTAIFSNIPHIGKLKAFIWTATPCFGTIIWCPIKVPFFDKFAAFPSTW